MHAADDDTSTLLPASSGIERDAADKAESAARAAASRVTAWLQRSPTGPLARARCEPSPALAIPETPEAQTTTADPSPASDEGEASGEASADATAPGPTEEADAEDPGAGPTLAPVPSAAAD